MKKKSTTLLFCLCQTLFCLGQDFTKGTIVTTAGDSIDGFIEDKDWKKNPLAINFKSQTGSIATMNPGQISQFKTARGGFYVSKILTIDKSEHKSQAIARKRLSEVVLKTDTVFLEVLLKGTASLYRLVDENSKSHYFLEKDKKIEELILRKFYSSQSSSIATVPVYQNQLFQLCQNCAELKDKVTEVKYTESDLNNFVLRLNNCSGGNVTFTQIKQKVISEWYIYAGANVSKINFTSAYHYLAKEDFSLSTGPNIGLGGNFILQKNRRIWSLYGELAYKSINTSSKNNDEIKAQYAKLNTGMRLTEPEKRNVYMQFGIFNSFAVSHEAKAFQDRINAQIVVDGFRKHEQGLFFGLGLNFSKRLVSEFRIESSNGFSGFSGLGVKVHSACLFLHFKLK